MSYKVLFEGMVVLPGNLKYSRVRIEEYSFRTEVTLKDKWDMTVYPSVTHVRVRGRKVSFTILPEGEKVEWNFRPYRPLS